MVQSLLDQCEAAGIPCDLVQGLRSWSSQQTLWDQGRSLPGPIVTHAQPGDSYHQYGLAVDIVPQAYKNLPNWNPDGDLWPRIGAIGTAIGLTWGGTFSHPDRPHFELEAAPIRELKDYWNKFQSVMPFDVTPSMGTAAIILLIAGVWYVIVKPQLEGHRLL